MRKSEQEITDRSRIDEIIRKCQVCRLGLTDTDGPYIVPMCFGYDGTHFYFHCAPEGRKLDVIRRNGNVCFELDIVQSIVAAEKSCGWSIRYQSVMGTGHAYFVDDIEEKRKALTAIMAQYSDASHTFPGSSVQETTILRVRIESITGKHA